MFSKKGFSAICFIIFFLGIVTICKAEFISNTSIQQEDNRQGQISLFLDKEVYSNNLLKIMGIKEKVIWKEFLLTVFLLCITILIIYEGLKISEITNKGVSLILSAIIAIIGNQTGILLRIAKKLISTFADISSLTKEPLFWIILALIVILIITVFTIIIPLTKKSIKKYRDEREKEIKEGRKRRKETLEEIEDLETQMKLKRYGIETKD